MNANPGRPVNADPEPAARADPRRLPQPAAAEVAGLARAASRSAEASRQRNPAPLREAVAALARRHGALGVAVSHTGPVIALILAPESAADPAPGLAGLGLDPVVDYRLGA